MSEPKGGIPRPPDQAVPACPKCGAGIANAIEVGKRQRADGGPFYWLYTCDNGHLDTTLDDEPLPGTNPPAALESAIERTRRRWGR